LALQFKRFPPKWEHLLIPMSSPAAARTGLTLYAPCRPLGQVAQAAALWAVRLGGVHALPGKAQPWEPPMGKETWQRCWGEWRRLGAIDAVALYERPQPKRKGLAVLLMTGGTPVAFVKLRERSSGDLSKERAVLTALGSVHQAVVWVPGLLAAGSVDGWDYIAMTALPGRRHRPPSRPDVEAVLRAVQPALATVPRPEGMPEHWQPMHGDFTPWNLREVPGLGLALVDWEDAGWGPPEADATLYTAAEVVLGRAPQPSNLPEEAVAYWRRRVESREAGKVGKRFNADLLKVLDAARPRRTSHAAQQQRIRLLLSAFGCHPAWGSEPEVGFRALMAAAESADVWVLTIPTHAAALKQHLAGHPLQSSVHLVPVKVDVPDAYIDRIGLLGFYLAYGRWQKRASRIAIDLDSELDFDVIHHVTVSSYWSRVGVASLGKPFVWGPVGGGVEPPRTMIRDLGPRGLLGSTARVAARRGLSRLPHVREAGRNAAFIFAQNQRTAQRLEPISGRLEVLSNATSISLGEVQVDGERRRDVVIAGRLLPWKGVRLAVDVLRHVRHEDVVLRIFGDGPERRRVQRAARRWGVADRVRFERWVPRDVLLAELATAGVLLHCALHEEAGLIVAEALSLQTPVVCLAHGGPAELVRQWPDSPSAAIVPVDRDGTVRQLAAAVDGFLDRPPPVASHSVPPVEDFKERLLAAYEVAVGRPLRQPGSDRSA